MRIPEATVGTSHAVAVAPSSQNIIASWPASDKLSMPRWLKDTVLAVVPLTAIPVPAVTSVMSPLTLIQALPVETLSRLVPVL